LGWLGNKPPRGRGHNRTSKRPSRGFSSLANPAINVAQKLKDTSARPSSSACISFGAIAARQPSRVGRPPESRLLLTCARLPKASRLQLYKTPSRAFSSRPSVQDRPTVTCPAARLSALLGGRGHLASPIPAVADSSPTGLDATGSRLAET
jgi:hypothetical protein